MPVPADEAGALARTADARGAMGHRVVWYATTSSTNDRALDAAHAGAAPGTVFVADTQTGGRGRRGRTWQSPPGAGLYVSVIVAVPREVVTLLTLAAGVAMAEGIQASTGLAVQLKWPNDLWMDGRKVGGILAESVQVGVEPAIVVLGVGVNLAHGAWPPEVAALATSLQHEAGRAVDRGLVLAECLVALRRCVDVLSAGDVSTVLDRWRTLAATLLRRAVEWDEGAAVRTGTAVDVDDTGALLVETPEGRLCLNAGEVRWR